MPQTEITPDLLEKVFCVPFDNVKTSELTPSEMEVLVALFLMPDEKVELVYEEAKSAIWLVKVIEKRLEGVRNRTATIDKKIILLLLGTSIDTVGKAVMWTHYLQYKAKKLNTRHLTMDDFCERVCPFGTPSNEEMQKLWDGQKGHLHNVNADNIIDVMAAYESILFETAT